MDRLKFLLTRYKNAESTPQEVEELLDLFASGSGSDEILAEIELILDEEFTGSAELDRSVDEVYGNLQQAILAEQDKGTKVLRLAWLKRFAIAASILVAVGVGIFYYYSSLHTGTISTSQYVNDIKPGGNRATIALGDGQLINLSADKKGVVINGQELAYNDGTALRGGNSGNVQMVTMQTPKGGQYEATLPDGTHVWLNAATTLKFPSRFVGNERPVELSGEAYFEVAKDKLHSFIVKTEGQEVEVLGTHFNINSYADEPLTATTLLEGSVKVTGHGGTRNLKPGQRSILYDGSLKVENVDAEDAIAWKNGLFIFDDEPLEVIMNRIKRWYDVEVEYSPGIDKKALYGGSVSRYDNISKVLKTLELTKDIHFKLEGRRVTVMK